MDALHPRFWPIADLATGLYNSERPDVADDVSGAAWLGGGGIGLTVPHDPAAETTNALTVRAGGGFAHNFWLGSSLDLLLTRQTPGGFFGAGAGLWGIGDTDILDGGVFGTAGFNLPGYTGAGQAQAFTELRLFERRISAPQNNFSGLIGVRSTSSRRTGSRRGSATGRFNAPLCAALSRSACRLKPAFRAVAATPPAPGSRRRTAKSGNGPARFAPTLEQATGALVWAGTNQRQDVQG